MNQPETIVIGAGIGGLAAAIRLASCGRGVRVFERQAMTGGKIRSPERADLCIDAGPTVLTMLEIFEALYRDAGLDLHRDLEPTRLETIAQHRFTDGTSLDLFADEQRTLEAIDRFAGRKAVGEYQQFMRRGEQVFALLQSAFLTRPQRGLTGLLRQAGVAQLATLMKLSPFQSYWKYLDGQFADPRLQQLFARYSTYCGSSPFDAPATLMLIAYLESTGVWKLRGGLRALATGLTKCATTMGVTFCRDSHVTEILADHGAVSGVRLENGERISADSIVFNGDTNALATGCLGPQARPAITATPPTKRSLSAITFVGTGAIADAGLGFHTVAFSDNYAREFEQLSSARQTPTVPTVYLCAPDHDSPGAQQVFVLINAPANGDSESYGTTVIEVARQATARQLDRCGIALDLGNFEVTTPADFHKRYPATGGALYGPAMHGWRAAFRRPGSRSKLRGLYLAGGSVHPGSGVPMAAISGTLAADCLLADTSPVRRRVAGLAPARSGHAD